MAETISRRPPSRAAARLRAIVLGALACMLAGGCFTTRRLPAAPATTARGSTVAVAIATPRDIVFVRERGDSLLMRGVRRLEGRLGGLADDTLLLRPIMYVETVKGGVNPGLFGPADGIRIALGEGVTATTSHRQFSRKRTAVLAVGVVLVIAALAAAASSIPVGFPDGDGSSF